MGTQFAHELVSPFLLLYQRLRRISIVNRIKIGWWNCFLGNNFEIIVNVEENKVFCAKIDYKRTAY
jgi:hypothetical protein